MVDRAVPPAPELLEALRAAVGAAHVVVEPERLEPYGRDETEALWFSPDVAVLPGSTAEVAAVLRLAHEARLPVTPRGAGTGLSGGALPVRGGIVLSLERMDRIRAIDERDLVAEVEAGVVLADLQPRVLAAMHGSTFVGDGAAALRSAADMLERRLGAVPVDVHHAV